MAILNKKLYIEDEKTTGIWKYTKYKDGTAVCHGIFEWNCTGWEQWGNAYTSKSSGVGNYAQAPDFPFEFKELPHLTIENIYSGTNNINKKKKNINGLTKTKPYAIKYVRPSSGGVGGDFQTSYLAIGKWK